MRIGVIADVHSNIVALDTMLDVFASANVDCICCLGDIIGIGPYPEEIVQRMKKIPNLYCVYGNHEEYFMKRNYEHMRQEEALFHMWEHNLLSKDSTNWITSLPKCINKVFDKVSCTIMHYGNDYKAMLLNPTGEQLVSLFANVDSQLVLYGHVHTPSIVQYQNRWFINPGSLGCPGIDKNICRGVIVNINDENISWEVLEVPYAVNEVLQHMEEVNCPAIKTIQTMFYGKEKQL